MEKLKIKLIWSGCAEGRYIIKAKGFILAILSWGNECGALEGWGAFAYIPIDPAGNGSFYFSGARSMPKEATRVYARCLASDFSYCEEIFAEIPAKFLCEHYISGNVQKFSVLTDLHLASKPWRIKRAFMAAQSENILLLGDSTNDGLSQQFGQFKECINDTAFQKILLPVIGNHDVLHASQSNKANGCENYAEFQEYLLSKAKGKGFPVLYDPDSLAYSIRFGNIDVIGIQCVICGRKFSFPEGRHYGLKIILKQAHIIAGI